MDGMMMMIRNTTLINPLMKDFNLPSFFSSDDDLRWWWSDDISWILNSRFGGLFRKQFIHRQGLLEEVTIDMIVISKEWIDRMVWWPDWITTGVSTMTCWWAMAQYLMTGRLGGCAVHWLSGVIIGRLEIDGLNCLLLLCLLLLRLG